ncbi:hypothetical protein AVEN_242948-1, partial [Araneus ventricosus]
YSSHL